MSIAHIAPVNVRPAILALGAYPDLWRDCTFRQDAERTAHRDTETIYLHAPETIEGMALVDIVPTVDHRAMEIPALRDLLGEVTAKLPKKLARAMIIKLKPGGKIVRHTDQGAFADATDRFHAVITTNPWVKFSIGTAPDIRMCAGNLYWFEKHAPHDGVNAGPADRIHLVVDFYR